MLAGPELARMTQECEESIPSVTKEDTRHHEQVPGVQVLFKKEVASLVSSFEEVGNPFEEDSKDLFVLDSKVIVENAVIQAVKNMKTIGQKQYNTLLLKNDLRKGPRSLLQLQARISLHCLKAL